MDRRTFIVLALTFVLASPLASSTWRVNGGHEPDTPDDVTNPRVWPDPDVSPDGMKVYFNAIPSDRNGATDFNPNLALLGSRILPPGQMGMSAWLGVWKDCNQDGYVGMLETAVHEYRVELLTDRSVCPIGSIWNHHNWVSEFIHIGPDTPPSTSAAWPRLIPDADARVWGDFGRPGNAGEVHYDCLQVPFPRGTFDSTGGFLNYFDCQLGYNVARNINEADAILGLGIAFDGPGGYYKPQNDCDNPLNVQLDTYGESPCDGGNPGLIDGNASSPMFTVWDCSEAPEGYLVDVRDPTAPAGRRGQLSSLPNPAGGDPILITDSNGTYGFHPIEGDEDGGIYARVANQPGVAPSIGNLDGSAYEGYQRLGDRNCDGDIANAGPGEGTLGANVATPNPADGKNAADLPFSFSAPCCIGTAQAYPQNAGVRGLGSGPWDSTFTYLPPTYMGGTIRTEDLRPAGGIWFTFYAYLGPTTIQRGVSLLNGLTATYGSEACGENDSGIHHGWNCDRAAWPSQNYYPGRVYQLRDTDCYDGLVVQGSGVFASLAPLSDDPPCPSP